VWNEEYNVGALVAVSNALLCEPSELIAERVRPFLLGMVVFDEMRILKGFASCGVHDGIDKVFGPVWSWCWFVQRHVLGCVDCGHVIGGLGQRRLLGQPCWIAISTLGEGLSTLGDGLGGTLGDVSWVATLLVVLLTVVSKMSASWRKAMSCAEPSCAKGVAGDGFCNVWIKSLASKIAASAVEVFGISKDLGKNSIVSTILAAAGPSDRRHTCGTQQPFLP
jgi:hypothetical protein